MVYDRAKTNVRSGIKKHALCTAARIVSTICIGMGACLLVYQNRRKGRRDEAWQAARYWPCWGTKGMRISIFVRSIESPVQRLCTFRQWYMLVRAYICEIYVGSKPCISVSVFPRALCLLLCCPLFAGASINAAGCCVSRRDWPLTFKRTYFDTRRTATLLSGSKAAWMLCRKWSNF